MFPNTARISKVIILHKYLILLESSIEQVDTHSDCPLFISKEVCLLQYLKNFYDDSALGKFQNELKFRLSLVHSYYSIFWEVQRKSIASKSEGLDENI
ncbi:MAG: hypothetical protein KKA84_08510 [Bacteroidetes bacterium]|nr:hypothetical protein [Bacteroidota bacterium]